tara:strand:+ start:794 stop:2491 length:1698 start_codon:yes stop_codon:yes gene_type:complete
MLKRTKYNILYLIVTISIITFIFVYLNKNKFHEYYLLKNFLFGDIALQNLENINYVVSEEEKNYKNFNKDFTINWSFRPEHFQPLYPKLSIADTNDDGIKELYYASQTKKVYELNALTGRIKRDWQFPIGQSSSKGTLLYKDNNDFYLLTSSTVTLPIKIYSLSLNNKQIELNWENNLHGQFVESGLNIYKDRIVVTTRDAPYSRGSLYIFNKKGERLYGPESTIDVCNARPIIENNYFIHGSHNFYNAKLGNRIVKRDINNGEIIWKTNLGFDTGFTTSNLIKFNNDLISDIVVYDIQNQNSVILEGRVGSKIDVIPGIMLDKKKDKIILLKNNNIYKKNNLKDAINLLKDNDYFNYDIEKLMLFLKNNKKINKFGLYLLALSSKEYDSKKNFIRNLILLNLSSLKDFKKAFNKNLSVDKARTPYFLNTIYFFDNTQDPGQNYFIITDKEYSFFEFHIFHPFKDKLIYLVYDKKGNIFKYKVIQLHFDTFQNDFANNFFKNSESIPFPNLTIAGISDTDNDNKLEIFLTIRDYLVSLNLDIENDLYDKIGNYPNKHNDNYIFHK